MNAIRLEKPGVLSAVTLDPPKTPGPGEALVRVRRIGVCGTDIHAFKGDQPFFGYPRILGHELGVEVISLADTASRLEPGDRCAVEPYLDCGACVACRSAKSNCCVNLKVLGVHTDGGMCEQILVPVRKLHPSSNLTFDQLALVETLGIGCHAVARVGIQKGEFALVIGAGPIGLAVIQFALEGGANVIVLDINSRRLEFCRKQLGVTHVIDNTTDTPLDSLNRITNSDLPTVVFDATGNTKSMIGAFDLVAHGGRIAFVGLVQGDITFNDPSFHRRELTLIASRNARPEDFKSIIRMIESGRIDTKPWITHRAPFAGVVNEFPAWTKPETGVIKAMIDL